MTTTERTILTAMWRMCQGATVSLVAAYGFAAANTWSCQDSFIDWAFCMIKMIQQL